MPVPRSMAAQSRPSEQPPRAPGAATGAPAAASPDRPDGARPVPAATRAGDRFRPDLEGLRAVAVLLVLAYHAGVPGLGGGFVGVDVFFVLSGFLITGLIIRELATTGTVSLPAFYARRARRLLPAALLVLAATMVVSAVVLPPLLVPSVAGDAAAAALYASNIRFAVQATDYLAADALPSPLLHYWSLGAEEQFYLFWPAFLLLVSTRFGGSLRRVGPAIAIVFVASLVLAVWLTGVSAPWAFFSLPTRAWELGIGGLIAVGAARLEVLPSRLAGLAGWVGLGLIVLSGIVIDASMPFPGTAAIVPVAGAALVVLAGLRPSAAGPARLLSLEPMRFLGRISYSLYVWHWPIIVLAAAALGGDLPLPVRVGLAIAAIPVAAASQRWVEEPIRRGHYSRMATRRTLALAGVFTVAVAIGSIGIGRLALTSIPTVDAGDLSALTGEPGAGLPLDPGPLPGDIAAATPRQPPSMTPAPSVASPATPSAAPATSTPTPTPLGGPVPANLVPPLAAVGDDEPVIYRDGCHASQEATRPKRCVYGDPGSAVTVALFGDSHAGQWFPALEALARANDWRLLSFTKSACTSADATVYHGTFKRAYTECDEWRARVFDLLDAERPDLVIISNSSYNLWNDGSPVSFADRPDLWAAAMDRTLARVGRSAGAVVVIGNTPKQAADPPVCLSAHLHDSLACATPRSKAVDAARTEADRAAASRAGATFVDPTPWLCSADTCPVVRGRYLVFRDTHHLTTTFSAALSRRLGLALPALGQ
jgi:peptidoglycan/LPS O-acetylase OafA/YrhL